MLRTIQGQHPLIQLDKPMPGRRVLFRVGEVFQGQVLERHGEAEVTVAVNGGRFRARTTLPLVPGARYLFSVQQERPQLMLQALDLDSSMETRLLRLWRFHAAARGSLARLLQELNSAAKEYVGKARIEIALQRLENLLPGLTWGRIENLDARWLARQLVASGLFWESKVARWMARKGPGRAAELMAADLKGALLSLEESLKGSGVRAPKKSLGGLVAQALDFVGLQQQFNLLSGPELGQWLWFIPGAEFQELQSAEIFIEKEVEECDETGKDGAFRLVLRLDFSMLGPVEGEVSLDKENISCQLRVSDERCARWISSRLPELKAALEESGFRVAFLSCEAGTILQIPPFLAKQGDGSSLLHVVV